MVLMIIDGEGATAATISRRALAGVEPLLQHQYQQIWFISKQLWPQLSQ
jgi:hypothetical protein